MCLSAETSVILSQSAGVTCCTDPGVCVWCVCVCVCVCVCACVCACVRACVCVEQEAEDDGSKQLC